MESNRRNICCGLLLVCSIIFGSLFGVCSNASAIWTADYGVRMSSYSNNECQGDVYTENHSYKSWFSGCHVLAIVPISQQTTATGDTVVYSGKLNLVKELDSNGAGGFYPYMQLGVRSVYFGNNELVLTQNPNITIYTTRWENTIDGIRRYFQTLTIVWTVTAKNNQITNTTGRMRITFYNNINGGVFDNTLSSARNAYYYFENTGEELTTIFVDTGSQGNNTIINQNNIVINQNEQIINQNKAYYDHEYEGEQNISNQTSSDIQGAENQQTTNLIGFIGSFVSAIQNVQASDCTLTLPFPVFAGGTYTANICDGKQYAPTIISVAGSLLLIGTFVPLAFIVLRMIYNEIRSWTNG